MQAGTLLASRYRVEARLGEGGMGVVFRAHDTLLDRPVAVKMLSPHLFTPDGLARLLREAQAAARLTHPNIVSVYDVVEDQGQRLIVMEYVEGDPLRQKIPLPWRRAVEVFRQVCAALDYAHGRGVVHRDIKPENIMLTPQGVAKVMDFGLARSEGRSRLTETSMVVGTVAYMAPEQALSGKVDARSDLYALGAALYETLAGHPPFTAEDPIAVISMHVNVPPVSPRLRAPDIPTALESMILRLLAKDPTERYSSARELGEVLAGAFAAPDAAGDGPMLAEAAPPPAAALDLMIRGRLIGRDEEMRALRAALESMLSARGQVVFIEGEPGIGKTRLMDELLVYARLRGCLVMVGRCHEQDVNVPYLPFTEGFRSALQSIPEDRFTDLVTPSAPELIKLVPELPQRLSGLTPSVPLEPEQERVRLFHNVALFVTGLARTQPVVLALDDLHWADAASLQLLRHVARGIRAERILIVGSFRDVEVARTHPLSFALSEMTRERLYRRVQLRGLPAEHVGTMIQSIFQTPQPVSEEFRTLIYRETEGNPFFVEEVLKHLVETGALYITDGRWERKPIDEIDVPRSIREVIGRRLEQVPEACVRVLGLAAVIGRRFRFEILRAIGDLSEDELLDTLELALAAQLIREQRGPGGVQYDFAHALIREVLYERLSLRRRMTLHERVGEALEAQYAGRLDEVVEDLAHHFSRSPQGTGLDKAIRYCLRAAERAMRVFAYEEAVRYYETAVELLAESGDERRLADARGAIGEPLGYLSRPDEAVAAYLQALAYFERAGLRRDAGRIERLTGMALMKPRRFAEAIPHLERALEYLDKEQDAGEVMRAHRQLAAAMVFTGQIEEAQRHGARVLALAQAAGDGTMEASGHSALALVAAFQDDIDRAIEHYTLALALVRGSATGEAYRMVAHCLNNLAVFAGMRGESDRELELTREAVAVSIRARDFPGVAFHKGNLVSVYFARGEWESARREVEDALQLPVTDAARRGFEGLLRRQAGDLEAALEVNQELRTRARAAGDEQAIVSRTSAVAGLMLALGRIDEACEAAREAAAVAGQRPTYLVMGGGAANVVEALARGGEHDRCKALCAVAEAVGARVGSPFGRLVALVGRGVLAMERGRSEEAVALLEESLPLAERRGAVAQARTLRLTAEAHLRRKGPGDLERARECLTGSLGVLEQMGDRRLAEQVRQELADLR